MEVKRGYKQSDLGIIPGEWTTERLGDLGVWKGGATPSMLNPDFWDAGNIPWASSGDVKSMIISDTSMKITDAALKQSSTTLLPPNSLIVVTRSGILRKRLPVAKNAKPIAINQDIKALVTYPGIDSGYLLQVLIKNGSHILATCLKSGTTVESVEYAWLKEYRVPMPPLVEQRAIADALGGVDALINALEATIAKKCDIKQAAIQHLLTGELRLPGFTEEWEAKRLGDLFQFLSTAHNSRGDLSDSGKIGYVHYGDIHTTHSAFLDCARADLPLIAGDRVKGIPLLQDGDLVMVDASEDYTGIGKSVEVQNVGDRKVVAGLHTLLLRGNKALLSNGFKGYIQFIPDVKTALVRLATGLSVYGISKSAVRSIEIQLPPPREQTAIAAVLSDMDAEIAALEAQRDKTRLLKQGMMQELLTGRTRLV